MLDGAGVAEEKVPDEPVAEEVVVDSAEYRKIVDKYTDKSGKLSYDLLNNEELRKMRAARK